MKNDGIFRQRKVNFTPVSNCALHDNSLSMRAKGLYAIIQSYITIPNFKLYKSFLIRNATEGQRAFDSAWKELKNAGYLKQFRIRTKGGFIYEYELLDEPDTSTPGTVNIKLDGEAVIDSHEEDDIENKNNDTDITESNITNDTAEMKQSANCEIDVKILIDEIKEQIDYEYFKTQNSPYIDSIIDIMLEVLTYPEETIQIGKEKRYIYEVQLTYKKLNLNSIEYLINSVEEMIEPINNPKAFWLTALYNAPKTYRLNQAQYGEYDLPLLE